MTVLNDVDTQIHIYLKPKYNPNFNICRKQQQQNPPPTKQKLTVSIKNILLELSMERHTVKPCQGWGRSKREKKPSQRLKD